MEHSTEVFVGIDECVGVIVAAQFDLVGPSSASLALENFTVQRASVSFCRASNGSSFQISVAVWPALILAFSSSVLR